MFGKKPEGVQKKKKKRSGMPAILWMFMGSLLTLMIGVFLYLWQPFKTPGHQQEPQDGLQVNNDDIDRRPSSDRVADDSNQKPKTMQQPKSTAEKKTRKNAEKDYEFYELLPEQDMTPIPDKSISVSESPESLGKKRADVTLKMPTEEFDDDVTYTAEDTYDGGPASATSNTEKRAKNASKTTTASESNDARDPIENIIASAQTAAAQAAKETIKDAKKNTYILQINSYDTAEEADKRRAEVLLAGVDAHVIDMDDSGEIRYQVISETYNSKTAVFMAQQRLQSSGIDAFVVERKK